MSYSRITLYTAIGANIMPTWPAKLTTPLLVPLKYICIYILHKAITYLKPNWNLDIRSLLSNSDFIQHWILRIIPDSKVHGANIGPTWVLSARDGPHVGPVNLAIGDVFLWQCIFLSEKQFLYDYQQIYLMLRESWTSHCSSSYLWYR